PSLRNGPDHQGLTTTRVTTGEDSRDVGLVGVIPDDISATVEFQSKFLDDPIMLGVGESHREDDQIGRKVVLTALVS
ncbi:hypothetical protein Q604_UNBC06815G0001, partial [human gut metagenome]